MKQNKQEYRHHYVPQFLLKMFSINKTKRKNKDDYPIYIYDIKMDKGRLTIPKEVLYKKILNTFKIENIRSFVNYYLENGGDKHILTHMHMTASYEDTWSRFDSQVATLYEKINNIEVDVELRALISFYFAGSLQRSLKHINKFYASNAFVDELYREYTEFTGNKFEREIDDEVMNDDEVKYFFYKSIFMNEDSLQQFTDFFPIILKSKSDFLISDNPIVILNVYKDYINGIGLKNEGVIAITPISKDKSILLLPIYFIEFILSKLELVLNINNKCIDIVTGENIDNIKAQETINDVIEKLFDPHNKNNLDGHKIPLVEYSCNQRDIELLNFLQIANSNRYILDNYPPDEKVKKYFIQFPFLSSRNSVVQNRYVRTDDNDEYEVFSIDKNDNTKETDDEAVMLYHTHDYHIPYNVLDGFEETIISKIQRASRIGFNKIERKYGDTLHILKNEKTAYNKGVCRKSQKVNVQTHG